MESAAVTSPIAPPPLPSGTRPRWMRDAWVVTPTEAAIIAGVSRRTIYHWIAHGLVQTRRAPSGLTRVVIESLWATPAELAGAQGAK